MAHDGTIEFGAAGWLRDGMRGGDEMLRVWRGASLELDLHTRDLDVAHWADASAVPGHFGLVSGDLRVSGPTTGPRAAGTLSVREFPAPPFLFPLIEGDLLVDGQGVRLEHGQIDLGGPSPAREDQTFRQPPKHTGRRGGGTCRYREASGFPSQHQGQTAARAPEGTHRH